MAQHARHAQPTWSSSSLRRRRGSFIVPVRLTSGLYCRDAARCRALALTAEVAVQT